MQVTRKYTDLFAEKLKATGDMQQAITKAVWIAYLDGIADSFKPEVVYESLKFDKSGCVGIRTADGNTLYFKIIEPTFIGVDWDETRIDVIGANGNEGLHYVE